MKKFMDKDFLLSTKTAEKLYHEYAETMPIIDYHCHINPQEIAENKRYENITQVWLYGDHYKWRAMRSCGVEERFITGDAGDYEKFLKWAEIMPLLMGNPLYHWAHLELKNYFGFEGALSLETAESVWNLCSEKLKTLSARDIIKMSAVEIICTTDDPADSLEFHRKIAEDKSFDVKVLPTFRPDKAMNIDKKDFSEYIAMLSKASDIKIDSFESLKEAIVKRIDFFDESGCRISDHAFEHIIFNLAEESEVNKIFKSALALSAVSEDDAEKYKTAVFLFVAREYAKRGWIMQIHYGTIRNTNSRMFSRLGADTGFDCISTRDSAAGLVRILDELEKTGELPKAIIYSLNPNDDAMIGSVIGCFQGEGIKNKIQHGSAWWFNDTMSGMVRQLTNLASLSALGNFVGMLTDSRSFLSYARHEYFRRILCNLIGGWVENGEYPEDYGNLKKLVEGICYNNAKNYFEF
ncbi:MAG: glucuronate isomerase [Clostridia bacterium]|nr:glucuronate isomerase [Clostridia bacterium]